ncbi:hypothetical protein ACHOLT_19590 [Desulfitobacterium sp. Sab5]|uniref:hypothetical protein n=1 Tax=Desulfitobacterium nosdiversum TaxID=3375356 RepID=UPI003CF48FE1
MVIGTIFISVIIQFAIIYFAVKLAIKPLLDKPETETDNKDFGLVKLRDIEILTNTELEDVIGLYQSKSKKKENYQQYKKFAKVLNDLKETGYFTDEEYIGRMEKLKEHFKV